MEFVENIVQKMNEVFETDVASLDKRLIQIAKLNGGKAYLVGGAVRDEIMKKSSKDRDYVITKMSLDQLFDKLKEYIPEAKINEVGKSFGIIKLSIGNDEFDIAIPRADMDRDNVTTDPNIPIEDDLKRRDMSINSGAKDLETGEIISPEGYDVVSDIKNKIIKSVGNPQDRFKEDPLRILRALSQSSRFGFDIEPKTLQAIKENIDLLKKVSSERFYEEFVKGWTKGNADTERFFNLLNNTGIGTLLFGTKFDPIILNKLKSNLSDKEFFLAQYIAAFLNGGDYTAINKKMDEQDYVKITHLFKLFIDNGINYDKIKELNKHSDKFEFILNIFNLIDLSLAKKLYKMLSKPLITRQDSNKPQKSWELPITGGELINISEKIGKTLKGKAVTETISRLIKAYQNDEISLKNDPELDKQEIEKYLNKNILKEHFVESAQRLDIIKKRINNILNT